MGVSRIEQVRAMLRRAGATVTESKAEVSGAMQLTARHGRYNGIDPRHDTVLFEFSNEAPNALDTVIISYGDASERLEYGRMDEFTRRWGISDGAEAQTWHGTVRRVTITLWRDQQTREFTETYSVYKPPAP